MTKHKKKIQHKLTCKNCKEVCCEKAYVILTPAEAKRFKKFAVMIDKIWFLAPIEAPCHFYKKGKGCTLKYSERPITCRFYPHSFTINRKKQVVLYLDKTCLLAKKFNKKDFEHMTKEIKKYKLPNKLAITEGTEWCRKNRAELNKAKVIRHKANKY